MTLRSAPDGLPMAAFVSDAEMLDPPRFAARHGAAFLVALGGAVPARTGARAQTKVHKGTRTSNVRVLVFPIVRQPGSARAEITVGRRTGNDIALHDETVSDLHALLIPAGTGYCAQDEGSRNGTRVEDIPVAARGKGPPTALRVGQNVSFGRLNTLFVDAAGLIDLVHKFKGSY